MHISELSWTKKINHPSDILAIGDMVEAIVLSVDKDNIKIALGVKQTEVNPWLLVEEKYEAGSIVEGKVRNITDYGVFVELEPGIDGMVHISDISWLKKVNHPSEFFKRNQKIQTKVLSIDQTARKISLGAKQLEEDPWKMLVENLTSGQIINGTITKIVNFGLFIDLGKNIEGLVHISEIPENKASSLENHYSVGKEINVMILKVDVDSRKIALTLKGDIPVKETEPVAPVSEAPPQPESPVETNLTPPPSESQDNLSEEKREGEPGASQSPE